MCKDTYPKIMQEVDRLKGELKDLGDKYDTLRYDEMPALKGEVKRLTGERDEANQAYHDLANEAQFAFAGYKLKRDNLKSRLSDAMEVVEGGRHFRATGQPDLLYDALAKLDGKVE